MPEAGSETGGRKKKKKKKKWAVYSGNEKEPRESRNSGVWRAGRAKLFSSLNSKRKLGRALSNKD